MPNAPSVGEELQQFLTPLLWKLLEFFPTVRCSEDILSEDLGRSINLSPIYGGSGGIWWQVACLSILAADLPAKVQPSRSPAFPSAIIDSVQLMQYVQLVVVDKS